ICWYCDVVPGHGLSRAAVVSMPSLSGWYCDGPPRRERQYRYNAVSMPSLSGWYCDLAQVVQINAGLAVSMPSLSGWYCDQNQRGKSHSCDRVSMPSLSGWYCDGADD